MFLIFITILFSDTLTFSSSITDIYLWYVQHGFFGLVVASELFTEACAFLHGVISGGRFE